MILARIDWTVFLLLLFGLQCTRAYRKYFVEDECVAQDKLQKIDLNLPASGPDSVGEIRSNRFGTYSRTGRNCLLKLTAPEGYGIVITVLKIDFRNPDGCKDYVKIFKSDDDGEELCGYQEMSVDGKIYFSDEDIKILYHTTEGGMGFNNGIKLIFTVTKLVEKLGACVTPEEFPCENSRCIWAGVTCDGINNCGDGSDEFSAAHPHCRTYQQLSKTFFSTLAEVTPVAIAAVVLGITSFVSILIAMCLCCCRSQTEKPIKPPLIEDFPMRPNGGYIPLPGYTYGSVGSTIGLLQPVHSPASMPPSAPMEYTQNSPSYPMRTGYPFVTQKVEIRYDKPPPYRA